jgi:TatD DNase family protein
MPVQSGQFVNIHAHRLTAGENEWLLTSLMTDEYPPVAAHEANYSVGIHPWKLFDIDIESSLEILREAIKDPAVLAIGEAGLDRFTDAPLETQLSVFEAQVQIAESIGIPVIIHMVKTAGELIRFMKIHNPGIPMIIHGFRGSLQLANDLVRVGFYLSFGEALVKSEKVSEAFRLLPLDRLFLETDESQMHINEIYDYAAKCRSVSTAVLSGHMTDKTNALFNAKSYG